VSREKTSTSSLSLASESYFDSKSSTTSYDSSNSGYYWAFDTTKKCFGGEYFVSVLIGSFMHLINFALLYISFTISTLYPSERFLTPKKNYLAFLPYVGFFVLSMIGMIFSETGKYSLMSGFMWTTLSYEAVALLQSIIFPVCYEPWMVFYGIIKLLGLVCVQIYLIMLVQVPSSTQYLRRNFTETSLAVFLISTIVLRLFWSWSNKRALTSSDDNSISYGKSLVYLVEKMKRNRDDRRLSIFFYKKFYEHQSICCQPTCLCKTDKLYIYFDPQKQYDKTAITSALFVTTAVLENNLNRHSLGIKGKISGDPLECFFLNSFFSMNNMGGVNKLILFIHGLINKFQAENTKDNFKTAKSSHFMNRFSREHGNYEDAYGSLKLTIIKTIIEKRITEFNLGIPPADWSYSFT